MTVDRERLSAQIETGLQNCSPISAAHEVFAFAKRALANLQLIEMMTDPHVHPAADNRIHQEAKSAIEGE